MTTAFPDLKLTVEDASAIFDSLATTSATWETLMLEQTDRYELGIYARQMTADSLGNLWFRGPLDEIVKHDLGERTTEVVALTSDASSFALTPFKAVYGTWGGEIWSMDFTDRKVVKLSTLPRNSPVVNLVVDSLSGMIFCSTKSELLGAGVDGSVVLRIPIDFAEDILAVGDRLWFVKHGRISSWNLKTNEVSMTSESAKYILLRRAMNGLIAGLRGELDLLSDEVRVVETVFGTVNQIAWDDRHCILGYANSDESINFRRAPNSVQTLDTYSVSNASSIVSVRDFGFVVSSSGDLSVFQNKT